MKICFITSENFSGKCGITDYVKLLAQQFEKLGHEVELCFMKKDCEDLPILPDANLYSIQFAPYAYATNGFPNQFLKYIERKLQNQKVHLNFHEIWIGDYAKACWKEKAIGWMQKYQILSFIKRCKPSYITSSNAAAINRLAQTGVPVRFLYLFGNIPYSSLSKIKPPGQTLKIAFFGTPYPRFPYDKLGKFLSTLSKTCDKKLEIILIGQQREDSGTDRMLSVFKEYEFSIERTGELSAKSIAEQLQESTIGVSTTPYDVIGKSGATAAMLEHGLPVLAYDDGDTPAESLFIPDPFEDQIFLINDHSSVEKLLQYIEKPRKSFFDGVACTANKMLDLFS